MTSSYPSVTKNPEDGTPLIRHSISEERDLTGDYIHNRLCLPCSSSKSSHEGEYTYPQEKPKFHVYKRRWWVLAVFSSLAFIQSFVWITFSTISASAKDVFGWTDATIALLIDWGNIPFIVFVVPMCWLLDKKGLRVATLLSAFFIVAGTGFRCISNDPETATPLIHVGHILNGVAGIVVTGAPSQVSAVWFPVHQRTTATSVSVLTNYLGIAFGYLIGPILVPHKPIPDCNNISWHGSHPCNNTTLAADAILEEKFQIMRLMYCECAASCVLFLAALAYFPSRPPIPPTASANQERLSNIGSNICQLFKNRNFWILCMGFSFTQAVAGNWLSVLGPALQTFGITQEQTGLMGMTSILAGASMSLVLARFVDYLGGKIKLILVLMLSCGCVSFIWYALLFYEVVPTTLGRLYPAVIMAGIVSYTGGPLYMEMSVEVAYPIQEGLVGTVLQAVMNLAGAFFLALFLIPGIGISWLTWTLIGSTALGILLACLQSETYYRSDLDRANAQINYQSINTSEEILA